MEYELYKRNPQNRWVRYYKSVLVEFTSSGLVFREYGTLLLMVDCPIRAIDRIETLQCLNSQQQETYSLIFRFRESEDTSSSSSAVHHISPSPPPLAIATSFKPHWECTRNELRNRQVCVKEAPTINLFDPAMEDGSPYGLPLPNLKNPLVQRYIVALRFSSEFQQFVHNLEVFYDHLGGRATIDPSSHQQHGQNNDLNNALPVQQQTADHEQSNQPDDSQSATRRKT